MTEEHLVRALWAIKGSRWRRHAVVYTLNEQDKAVVQAAADAGFKIVIFEADPHAGIKAYVYWPECT